MLFSISFHNVSKKYSTSLDKETIILDQISFDIPSGEFLAILGPSGCGKSTIIKLMAGFMLPSSGQIILSNQNRVKPAPDRVIVSQDYGVFPWKTALENVEFALKYTDLSQDERKRVALRYLEITRIADIANSYPKHLSSGMLRRLELARALAIEPDCLLMDEPFVGLDTQLRYALHEDILEIWGRNKPTVVLVTHDLEEALYLSDRILFMSSKPGRIRKIVNIPFDRPRLHTLRLSDDFQAYKRKISKYLDYL